MPTIIHVRRSDGRYDPVDLDSLSYRCVRIETFPPRDEGAVFAFDTRRLYAHPDYRFVVTSTTIQYRDSRVSIFRLAFEIEADDNDVDDVDADVADAVGDGCDLPTNGVLSCVTSGVVDRDPPASPSAGQPETGGPSLDPSRSSKGRKPAGRGQYGRQTRMVLRATLEAFCNHGPWGRSDRELFEELGTNRSTFYRHFGPKAPHRKTLENYRRQSKGRGPTRPRDL
jgi:hypothetical protein